MEMQKQTEDLTSAMDEKLLPVTQELRELRSDNIKLKERVAFLERKDRENNLLLFGLQETEQSQSELMKMTIEKIQTDLNITMHTTDINKIYRIGRKDSSSTAKTRPTMVSLTNSWRKTEILKNKKKLREVYVTEDFPKEVLNKRRELQEQLIVERNKGNFAVLSYDRLIIKENNLINKDKRKRDHITSPDVAVQPRKQHTAHSSLKTNRINAFDAMRGRSNSFTSTTNTSFHPA